MKKETSKILTILFASIVLASFMIGLVSATWINVQYTPPENAGKIATEALDTNTWYGKVLVTWLGFGETWALVIASIMVMLIIISGIYDILYGFSVFSQPWVMFIIAFGVGVIAGISGTVRAVSILIFGLTGVLGAVGIFIGILIPIIIFVIANIIFFRAMNKIHTAKTVDEIKNAGKEVGATMGAMGDVARGMRQARNTAEKA